MIRKFWFGAPMISGLMALAVISIAILFGIPAYALKMPRIELAELPDLAEVIVLAKVLDTAKISVESDEVTIKIVSVIKGSIEQDKIKITIVTRGIKGFDPMLKPKDLGVFFLREVSEAKAKLAYQGSVAVFGKSSNFEVSWKSKKLKDADMGPKNVKLETSMGDVVIELNEKAAPVTVKNFLRYVEEGFFDGTIFHRVIPNFMIQGGGFTTDMKQKTPHQPIVNEAGNGLKNDRGTIAMARTRDPNSATCQFFINQKNNDSLNYVENRNPGYVVFGKVVEGLHIVDAIAAVKTTQKGRHTNAPVEPVVIKSARVVSGKQD